MSFFPAVDFVAVLAMVPRPVAVQVGEKDIPGFLELVAVAAQVDQPDRKVNSSLSLRVFFMTVLRWAMAWTDMARHRFT